MSQPTTPDDQLAFLAKGSVDFIEKNDLRAKLQRGKPLTVKVNAHVEANSFALLGELVAAGHGIARLPEYMATKLQETHDLRGILGKFSPPATAWHVVYPSSRNLSPKVRALVEVLERHFSTLGI